MPDDRIFRTRRLGADRRVGRRWVGTLAGATAILGIFDLRRVERWRLSRGLCSFDIGWRFEMTRQAVLYGAVMAVAIFFVGWVTGMGGSFVPNLVFSLLMGALAVVCYIGAMKLSRRGNQK